MTPAVHRSGRRAVAAATIVIALAGCGRAGIPDLVAAEVVRSQPTPVETPPRDADLADAGWPAVAAWIAREAQAGRPTVVNVFASWCGPCRDEAPLLRAAAAVRDGIAFLGVDHQDLRAEGRQFVDEQQLGFATLYDVDGEVARAVGSTGMPTTAFFDRTGRLVAVHVGPLTAEDLDRRLAELVAAAPP